MAYCHRWQWDLVTKGDNSWRIATDGSGTSAQFANGFWSDPNFVDVNATQQTINDDTWHHVVGTYDSIQAKIYIDGVLDASLDRSPSVIMVSESVLMLKTMLR